jgi:predicted Fe-Mo cluster-binding NifX family protein
MPYKIALTSSDEETVDRHFGQTDKFQILEVHEDTGAWNFLELRKLDPEKETSCQAEGAGCGQGTGCGAGHGHLAARLDSVIKIIFDCKYLLTLKIGPKPHEVLKRAGITALESPADLSLAISKLNSYHLKYAEINQEKRSW